jgi:hypothetical protein
MVAQIAENLGRLLPVESETIDTCWLMYADDNWTDLPASYHTAACGFGLLNGHGEIKKCWKLPPRSL